MDFDFVYLLGLVLGLGLAIAKILIGYAVFRSVFGKGIKNAIQKYVEYKKQDRYYKLNRAQTEKES